MNSKLLGSGLVFSLKRNILLINSIKILLFMLFFTVQISAQNGSNSSIEISASLIKALGSEVISGDLDFGEIVLTNISSIVSKTPDEGITIRLSGHPNKSVLLNFSTTEMTNSEWASGFGGDEGILTFNPMVQHTSSNSTYTNPIQVSSGNSYTLENLTGDGLLYLWVGGNITINEDQPAGDYTGVFQINISY